MKTRKSSSYLIVSSSHLGVSSDILKVFGNVASEFKTKVYHLGELETQQEIKALQKIQTRINSLESRINKFTNRTKEDIKDRVYEELRELNERKDEVASNVICRVKEVQKAFKDKVTFLIPSDSQAEILDEYRINVKTEYDEAVLSQYLMLSAIQPVSDVSTIRPTNRNAIQALKQYGNKYSWIVPHPVPSVIPYPRPGLNNAHNYCTVGSMKHIERPTRRQRAYTASHAPAAVLVVVDQENGEFHAVHLHIDYLEKVGYNKKHPVVLYDGMLFTAAGIAEIPKKGRGVFVTDEHHPYHHPGVLGATRTLNNIFTPYTFINGGDTSDCEPVNRHNLEKPGTLEGLRLCDMFDGLKKLLDAQTECDSIKERVLIDSNHHDWVTQFTELHPQLKGLIDWETMSEQKFPNWNIMLRQGEKSMPYRFGDYTVRHGDQESFQKAELIFEGGKYLCGHWHRYQAIRRMVSAGCGCGLNPPYMKNKENDWQNQVTTLTSVAGVTAIAPKIVLHDKNNNYSRFLYRDKIIETKAYHL